MRAGLNLLYLIPGVVGGTETYARATLAHLFRRSDIDWVVFVSRNFDDFGFPLPANVRVMRVDVDASLRWQRYWAEQRLLPRLAKELRLDLLHSMGYVSVLRAPCPAIVTIHDLNYLHIPMPWHRRVTLEWFVTRSARRASAVVTVSEFSKREICERLGVPPDRVCVTPNAPVDGLSGAAPVSRQSRKNHILALSSPSPHKNIQRLIEAFRRIAAAHPAATLVIAGHLSADVSVPSDLRPRIELRGYIGRTELAGLYQAARAFIMPSLYEGFGIPVVEAMSVGTPVACSNAASLPEIAGDAALMFDPRSVDDIAAALSRLLDDDDLWEKLGTAGRARSARFTWEESAAVLLRLYERVVRESKASN